MKKTPLPPRSAPLRSREPARGGEIKRKTRMKGANRERKAANLERAHGPAERREWIKTLPCANCGIVGYSEGAHIKNGGMSKKADARFIVPLCGQHHDVIGCHATQHIYGWSALWALDCGWLRSLAADRTEAAWQSHIRQTGRARQERE